MNARRVWPISPVLILFCLGNGPASAPSILPCQPLLIEGSRVDAAAIDMVDGLLLRLADEFTRLQEAESARGPRSQPRDIVAVFNERRALPLNRPNGQVTVVNFNPPTAAPLGVAYGLPGYIDVSVEASERTDVLADLAKLIAGMRSLSEAATRPGFEPGQQFVKVFSGKREIDGFFATLGEALKSHLPPAPVVARLAEDSRNSRRTDDDDDDGDMATGFLTGLTSIVTEPVQGAIQRQTGVHVPAFLIDNPLIVAGIWLLPGVFVSTFEMTLFFEGTLRSLLREHIGVHVSPQVLFTIAVLARMAYQTYRYSQNNPGWFGEMWNAPIDGREIAAPSEIAPEPVVTIAQQYAYFLQHLRDVLDQRVSFSSRDLLYFSTEYETGPEGQRVPMRFGFLLARQNTKLTLVVSNLAAPESPPK